MTTDAELLNHFVRAQSNTDFTELVRRHIDVVYHAALRRSGGRASVAADITQDVFVLLARKAPRLVDHPMLAGWLHSATRNFAHAALRKEARRQQHEQEAAAMNFTEQQTPDDWPLVRKALDQALDELSIADREAILLRFFHKKTFTEVGTMLGLSEDTARKRVDRALEKLNLRLCRRGLTSTATALAASLGVESALAAPVGYAAAVAQTALTTGTVSVPTLVIAKLMSIKTTLGIVGTISIAAVATITFTHKPTAPQPLTMPAATDGEASSKPMLSPNAKQPSTGKEQISLQTVAETLQSNIKALSSGQKPASASDSGGLVIFDADKTFVDAKYKFGAQLPEGWRIQRMERWGTEETTIYMRDPSHADARPSVYYQMFSEPMQPVDTTTADAWLRSTIAGKAKSRLASGYAEYVNGEVTSRTINDRPAVTWTAEYNRNGEPWSEYLTRIYSNNCTVLYFLNAPKKDLPAMIPGFENIIQTSVVP